MQSHPHTHRHAVGTGTTRNGALIGHGCGHGICSMGEGHEKSISLRIDLLATICLERGTQQVSTFGQYAGGALDVCEEERDGACRELMHTAPPYRESACAHPQYSMRN